MDDLFFMPFSFFIFIVIVVARLGLDWTGLDWFLFFLKMATIR